MQLKKMRYFEFVEGIWYKVKLRFVILLIK